jgi:hypothetical protein
MLLVCKLSVILGYFNNEMGGCQNFLEKLSDWVAFLEKDLDSPAVMMFCLVYQITLGLAKGMCLRHFFSLALYYSTQEEFTLLALVSIVSMIYLSKLVCDKA